MLYWGLGFLVFAGLMFVLSLVTFMPGAGLAINAALVVALVLSGVGVATLGHHFHLHRRSPRHP